LIDLEATTSAELSDRSRVTERIGPRGDLAQYRSAGSF
jgi:hypothetical protein